ncbi:TPA: streptodornase B [Streptococcus pyogenes]|uniref:streptodornase B n=1 Tax=Streptococcus pyogenes TaxID=1314 RepID=UPI00025FD1E0|nr:streptodornase B [Streptococcus pyogenes]HEP6152669.1 streptodornase B [Streptococcus pyogenes ABC020047615]HEP6174786.1 streptodornase B [Streptococcus pyogenes ABC020056755]HEP6180253.1 streptodornase B [Streptococcus pyogenes ABC020057019]HEP6183723.1 streptodornase B [Streptococcus pyogenes ABC020061794]HEP6185349.1 streptodornase B [Streptococcus pyogenes ABC020040056]HEP6190593.1 streptodornase B [Streptococcus pyogenes ABC020061659]HEP6200856.1 streptodornase B [Streptococcus pyoge
MNLLGSRRVFSKKCRLVKFSMVALVSATMAVTTVTLENTALARQTQVSNDVVLNDGASKYLNEALAWTFNDSPNYYKTLGTSQITPALFPKAGDILYSKLDELGRTRTARGTLTYANVEGSYGVRQSFGKNQNPAGWTGNPNHVKYKIEWLNGLSYVGDFWNRSHLIADSLGGDALRVNAVTGTRTQNVGGRDQKGGMRYTEQRAQEWLEANRDGYLYYEAAPIYNADELIPRAVVVSMQSSDNTINEKVLVYNTANGYTINYHNGAPTQK